DFKKHFKYLFSISDEFSLNTRFVDIEDYKMVLKGVCEYILNDFTNNRYISLINPINIFLDKADNEIESPVFEEFYNLKSYKELTEMLGVKVPNKLKNNNEEEDVIKTLKDKI